MTVSPAAVLSDGGHDVTVTASATVLDTGVAQQTITQLFSRQRLQLGSAAGVVAPAGWTVTYTSDGTTFGAAPTDAAGWAAVRGVRATGSFDSQGATSGKQVATHEAEIPTPPASAFSGSGSGDGWDVFFDDADHVFNIFHHDGDNLQNQGAIDCHTRTGASCGPGWPFSITPLHSGMRTSGWVDSAHGRLWFPTNSSTGTGFACVDISNFATGPAWCGGSATAALTVLGTSFPIPLGPNMISCNSTQANGYRFGCAEGLAQYEGRLFTWEGLTGKILCLDTNAAGGAGAACAGQPYSFPPVSFATTLYVASNSGWRPELQISGGRLYGIGGSTPPTFNPETVPANTYGVCLDPATLQTCTGWETPKSLTAGAVMFYGQPNAAGELEGVCFKVPVVSPSSSPNASCFTAAGQALTTNAGLASALVLSSGEDGSAQKASFAAPSTVGSRVYWGDAGWNGPGALRCYDVATSASCAGFPISVKNYTLVVDPANDNCFWKNGHDGLIGSYDSLGRTGCVIGPATAAFQADTVVPRTACSGVGTVRAWRNLTLTSPATGFTSASVTVRNAAGAVVTSGGVTWSRVPLTANTALDLANLAVVDTGENPTFTLQFTGRTNADTVKAKLTAMGDAPELCLTMRAQEACPTGAQFAPAPTNVTGSGEAVMTAGGTTTYTPTTVQVEMTAPSTCPVTTPPVAPTPTPMGTVNKTSLPVAMPDYAKTQRNVPVRLFTLANDAGSKGYAAVTTSIRMKNPTTGSWVTSLTIDGEGTFALDPPTGDIIFTPVATFTGTVTPVAYRFEDTDGKLADSTLHVTVVAPPGPFANPDHVAGMRGETLRLVPLYNDADSGSSFLPSTLQIKDPKTGKWVTTLKVRGEGTYTVSTTGKVAFKPLKTFVGTATPQTYQVSTTDGTTVTSTLHPVIRSIDPHLTISTTAKRTRLAVGAQTTISVRYCNIGSATATSTVVKLPIPKAFAVASTRGAQIAKSTASWTIGDLKPGICATKRIVVRAVGSGRGLFTGAISAANAARATDPAVVRIIGPTPAVTG